MTTKAAIIYFAKSVAMMAVFGFILGALVGLFVNVTGINQQPALGWSAVWLVGLGMSIICTTFSALAFTVIVIADRIL